MWANAAATGCRGGFQRLLRASSVVSRPPTAAILSGAHNNSRTLISPSRVWFMPVETINVPTMGDSITEGTVVDLPIAVGDYVTPDDVVVVLETDKVSVDVRANVAGAVTELLGDMDDVVAVGAPLFRIDTDAKPPEGEDAAPPKAAAAAASEATSSPSSSSPPSSPSGAPPAKSPPPTPPSTEAPAAAAAASSAPPPPKKAAAAPPASSGSGKAVAPSSSSSSPPPTGTRVTLGTRQERRTKLSRMRKRVAARLKDAQNTAAMLTTFQECDMGALMELRNKHKDAFMEKHGIKLGFMSAFVLAATAALQEIPAVNAYIDDATEEIVYREFVDISVAVASPTGLVVPVLRNTETMSFADVERNIAMYGQKAKDGTLSLDDMAGGTFTISNGGVFGSLMGTPIINPPQSAILGMHATKLRAVVNDKGEVVARPMMYLALTYDHRLIDGREGVTFLKSIAEKITDPNKLLLDL